MKEKSRDMQGRFRRSNISLEGFARLKEGGEGGDEVKEEEKEV